MNQQQSSISSDLIRGHIDTIILHTLIDGDKFAQEISDAVEKKSDNEYKINQATLYSSLKRLETIKCVASYWNDSEVGGRRKFFSITEKGKQFVNDNLSNWSYSRSIIDRLMDCAPAPVVKTEYVEKVVEVPKEVVKIVEVPKEVVREVPVKTTETINNSENVNKEETTNKNSNFNAFTENTVKNNQSSYNNDSSNQEINYKNILNGLIKANQIQPEEIEPENSDPESPVLADNVVNDNKVISEKADFNKTISETDYNEHRTFNGKIDFGDLALKAAKEGYKLRVSSKYSYISNGTLLLNRLNLFSSMIIYLVAILEFLFFSFFFKNVLNMSVIATIVTVLVLTVFPVVMFVLYKKQPLRSSTKKIGLDTVFTSAIIVFNLIVITFACTLLFDFDYTNQYSVLLTVVIPVTVYFDIFAYYLIRFLISKSKLFNITKKTA